MITDNHCSKCQMAGITFITSDCSAEPLDMLLMEIVFQCKYMMSTVMSACTVPFHRILVIFKMSLFYCAHSKIILRFNIAHHI